MSTLDAFRAMSGITQTSFLHVDPERAQKIIETVSARDTAIAAAVPVTLLPVSTYVNEAKSLDSGLAYAYPKQPPFALHWGIIIGDPAIGGAFLLHLLLRGEGAARRADFYATNVKRDSHWLVNSSVQSVGQTKYSIPDLTRIGDEMIEAFGNYHLVFWNCQMFAKCYLRVITGDVAVFTQWTSADVTNLFLCALVVPAPVVSTSRRRDKERMKQLGDIGVEAAASLAGLGQEGAARELTENEVLRASDAVIDLMRSSWYEDDSSKGLSGPMKDSSDKVGLMRKINDFIRKAVGAWS
jgi:hypothetical protein